MREPVEARRSRILQMIRDRGEVRLSRLAAQAEVSMVTVRRDVEALVESGAVERGHGVARVAGAARRAGRSDGAQEGTIAVVAPERHPYLNEVMQGAREALERAGFRVVLHLTPHVPSSELDVLRQLSGSAVDGILLAPRWRTPEEEAAAVELLGALELPTVLVERSATPSGGRSVPDSVRTDHRHGVRLALDHLLDCGHRRVLLASRQDSPTARRVAAASVELARAEPRLESWMSVLSSSDGAPHPGDAASAGPAQSESGAVDQPDVEDPDWLGRLLAERGATAVLVHSDENALVLSQRLEYAGVRIPEDCAVVAYDDVVAELSSVPLTAVSPPRMELGRAAADLVVRRVRSERTELSWAPHRLELLPRLRVRSST